MLIATEAAESLATGTFYNIQSDFLSTYIAPYDQFETLFWFCEPLAFASK